MNNKFVFVSQRDTEYSENGCGVAAILMQLKSASINTPNSFKEMAELLNIDSSASQKWGSKFKDSDYCFGIYPRDVTKYLDDYNISYISISDAQKKASWECLKILAKQVPVMVGMKNEEDPKKWGEWGHWIVITNIDEETVTYCDPYSKKNEKHTFEISIANMKNEWDGYAIAIIT